MIPLPLKQGLKPDYDCIHIHPRNVMIPLPLKQGLKLSGHQQLTWCGARVMIPLPLKQGLKLGEI